MFGRVVSRRAVVFWCALAAVLAAPLSPSSLLLLGRVVLAYAVAAAAARLLAPLLPRPTLPDLHRRAVLVTGCSSGFGFQAALALDAEGIPVLAACLDLDDPGVISLRSKASPKLRVLKMDVSSDESVAAAVEEVKSILNDNQLWAVVNNAGIFAGGEGIWMDDEDTRRGFEVNTFGMVRVTKAFVPMLRASRGRIVNTNSLACRLTVGVLTPYTMTKKASLAFFDGLREELRRFGISVHTIEPYAYNTTMVATRDDVLRRAWEKCPEHIKQMYGPNYLEKMKERSRLYALLAYPESKTWIVANAIVDACIAQDPQDRYTPSLRGTAVEAVASYIPWATRIVNSIGLPSTEK